MSTNFKPNFSGLDRSAWLIAAKSLAESNGDFTQIGDDYLAVFIDRGKNLVVSFEDYQTISDQHPDQLPVCFEFAETTDDSVLLILSTNGGWFRQDVIYRYFDRLVDDGFFEDFQNVLFYGAKKGAYAAAAYSLTAPNAHVLAICAVATLEPKIAGWDRRFLADRKINFSNRYGYAPDMIDTARHAHCLFDPFEAEDFMHAQLFRSANVALLRAPHLGQTPEQQLRETNCLNPLIDEALSGKLTHESFRTLTRARRTSDSYLVDLIKTLRSRGKQTTALRICDMALAKSESDPFIRLRAEIQDDQKV